MIEITMLSIKMKIFFIIHMCIQCLGHFSPLPYALPCPLPLPQYLAETILPLSLILL
jgi:hypothetical protein